MGWFGQLKLLLWKNFLLSRRRPISTLFEILLPIFFIFILFILRVTKLQSKDEGPITMASVPLGNSLPVLDKGNPNKSWTILFTPHTSLNVKIMSRMKQFLDVNVKGVESENVMVGVLVADNEFNISAQQYLCGVVFLSSGSDLEFRYDLRFPSKPRYEGDTGGTSKWNTKFVFPFTFQGLGPRGGNSSFGGPPSYYMEGFLSVQKAIDFAVIQEKNGSFSTSMFEVKVSRFPYPKIVKDPFIVVIQISLPLMLMLSLVYTAVVMVRNIVYEKEKRLKESMKMMGLSDWLHWLAWFTKCFVFLLISMSVITVFLSVNFGGKGKMLKASDGSLIFVFLILYSIASIMFCFFVSTLFYRASIAAAGGGILWFLSYIPYFFLANYYDRMSGGQKMAACLDFNIAMSFGSNIIGRFEGQGSGVQWSTLGKGVTVDDKFSFGQVLIMLVIDSLMYGLLTWYIEGVFPGEYGVPKKWYFPILKSYWFNIQEVEDESTPLVNLGFEDDDDEAQTQCNLEYIETVSQSLKPGIKLQNLSKQFKTKAGKKMAVDHLNLNFYEGEITALLGHNGAGKTTTISMLTGLFPPTSGNAIVNGYDILSNMNGIRKSLGICPQHNVLFDNLTVAEHLWFFSSLKGNWEENKLKEEVDRMTESIGLLDKKHVLSKKLSGGMKRKLSVGIALVGDSKVVMLDEPTSGMDVSARRFTWDLLLRERRGRTIILTTHYMDEADVLGDRIAIMADGKVKCCGSPLFLKNKYGVGYHLVMVKSKSCDVDKVTELITYHVPTAQLESNVGLELSFLLPSDYSSVFENLFNDIEYKCDELGIVSYGASVTTLQEVFIKVNDDSESTGNETHQKLFRQLSGADTQVPGSRGFSPVEIPSTPPNVDETHRCDSDTTYTKNTGMKLWMQRLRAMFVKKILHSRRHKLSIISQLLVPCINVLLALIVVKTMPKVTDSPPRQLDLSMFGKTIVPYSTNRNSTLLSEFTKAIRNDLLSVSSNPVHVKSKENMSSYLLHKEQNDLAQFNLDHPIAIELNQQKKAFGKISITAWYNNEAFHTAPVAINTLSNSILQLYDPHTNYRIVTINKPLPPTSKGSLQDLSIDPNGFQIGFSLCFGMAFLASSFVVFLVQERSTKAKHVQFVSGVDPVSYWLSAYLWDLINFVIPAILVILLFVIFQFNAYTGPRIGYVFLLIMLYGWAIIPLMYLFSFLFQVASTAFTRMTILNIITGLATLLVIFILSIRSLDLLDIARVLKWVFLVMPNYNLGQGMIDLFNNYNSIEIYNRLLEQFLDKCMEMGMPKPQCTYWIHKELSNRDIEFQTNYLSWDNPGIGRFVIFLTLEGIFFFCLVLLVEYSTILKKRIGIKPKKADDISEEILDSDVLDEKMRITENYRGNDVLVMKNLTKYYGGLTAVDGLYLGIPHGECFGLLGQNGAGKTTTFKMLTGDESITDGSAYIDSFNVVTDIGKVRQRIGYCPQFDALIDLMTGRELLTMYSRLRGVPENLIPRLVERLAQDLTVDAYMDRISKTYSGGNKRKLSTAIALVGDPSLVFLDEPSSGMDPIARRMLWNSLSKFIALGKSIVITSHSMEECEALCNRISIMVNGQFKCLGSPQYLKTKFGAGYTLIAKVGTSSDTAALQGFVENTFPGSVLKDLHENYVHYQLTAADRSWANLFGTMERAKETYNIEDYSISQTTLEQIFMNFTMYQREDSE